MNSEDLKKIREALKLSSQRVGNINNRSAQTAAEQAEEALRLFDEHVAALAQQEAEPVALWRDLAAGEIMQAGDRCITTEGKRVVLEESGHPQGWRSFIGLERHKDHPFCQRRVSPPKPAPLPQRHLTEAESACFEKAKRNTGRILDESVPQDAEQFANDVAEWSQTQFEDVIRVSHFREFMRQRDAGSVRVPDEVVIALSHEAPAYRHSVIIGEHHWNNIKNWVKSLTASKEGV